MNHRIPETLGESGADDVNEKCQTQKKKKNDLENDFVKGCNQG